MRIFVSALTSKYSLSPNVSESVAPTSGNVVG